VRDPISAHKELRCHVNQLRKYIVREEFEFMRPPVEDNPNDVAEDPGNQPGDCYLPLVEERDQADPENPQTSRTYEQSDLDDD